MKLRDWALYRWWVGGLWAFKDGAWWHTARSDQNFVETGYAFRWSDPGIERREDRRSIGELRRGHEQALRATRRWVLSLPLWR